VSTFKKIIVIQTTPFIFTHIYFLFQFRNSI